MDQSNSTLNSILPESSLSPLSEEVMGKPIAEGSHADVYKIQHQGKEYVVKVGKTEEYAPPILNALKIKFSREKASKFFEKFLGPEFKIMPDEEFIRNGIAEYLLMKEYFGSAPQAPERRKELKQALSDREGSFYIDVSDILPNPHINRAIKIIEKHFEEDFLPKEKTLIGYPPNFSREKIEEFEKKGEKAPKTYYLIQEAVSGDAVKPLYEVTKEDLKENTILTEKLLLFAMLAKKMYHDTNKLIDTRPEEAGKHPFEWFQQTSNILADVRAGNVYFIDTRWLWDSNSIVGKKGINLIENLGVNSINRSIKEYSEILDKS